MSNFICEHGNEVHPSIKLAFCKMPDSWHRTMARRLDPDVCLFVAEASALREQASKLTKGALK